MRALFLNLLGTSLAVGGLALLLTLASPLWNRRFAALWKKRLWCLLAVLGLAGIFLQLPGTAPKVIVSLPQQQAETARPAEDAPPVAILPDALPETGLDLPAPARPLGQPSGAGSAAQPQKTVQAAGSMDALALAEALWAAGAAAALVWLAVGEALFRRQVRRWARPARQGALLETYQAVCAEMGGGRAFPPLLIFPEAKSPLLTGLLRPQLLLPTEEYTPEEAAFILRHELAHWRGGDLWWKLLLWTVNTVHWFNPAMWLLRREANRDIERACDDRVIEHAGAAERRAYSEVLLAAAGKGRYATLSTQFGGARAMRERLRNIAAGKKRRGAALAAVCAVAAVCLTALVSCEMGPVKSKALPADEVGGGEAQRRTVLLLGLTREAGSCDTIMLLTYDKKAQAATVMTIPQDTMVNVPWDIKRINSVYHDYGGGQAGIDAMKTEVAQLVGFAPDHTVAVYWETVGSLVDAAGGVYFNVPRNMDYDDPYQDLSIHIDKGYQLLDGEQAVGLLRYRQNNGLSSGYAKGDLGRIETQQAFLKALAEKVMQAGAFDSLSNLAGKFLECVTTDMTAADLLWFAKSAANGAQDLTFVTMPCEQVSYPSRTTGSNQSYLLPKADELLALVNASLNPQAGAVAPEDLDILSIGPDGQLQASGGQVEDLLAASWVWPADSRQITAAFGEGAAAHDHICIASPEGAAVYAALGGTVTETGFQADLGNYIVLSHSETVETVYAHLSEILVETGDAAASGQKIGASGKTGRVTGPCLAFHVQVDGRKEDPLGWYKAEPYQLP